ncbi:MAG: hypothetical protein JSU83_02250 [Deltaproteobacteria bacterium]|nr:MAG: hypothetical protein JSU83_02250 [Deltaproteobacteria bacterium]
MKFEHLIWIIIFLVWVVSVILKRVRAASKTGEKGIAKRRPEWKEKLDNFLSKAQQELKAAKQEDSRKESDWEKVLPREDHGLEPIRKEISPKRMEQVLLEKTSSPRMKPAPVKAVAESIEPAVSGKEILPKGLEYGIQDLRKAVIWSEILAPPLALRDE